MLTLKASSSVWLCNQLLTTRRMSYETRATTTCVIETIKCCSTNDLCQHGYACVCCLASNTVAVYILDQDLTLLRLVPILVLQYNNNFVE